MSVAIFLKLSNKCYQKSQLTETEHLVKNIIFSYTAELVIKTYINVFLDSNNSMPCLLFTFGIKSS